MTEPKKHHYLPQFYLRGFAADGERVCQIEKAATTPHYPCALRDVAAIRDYHRLDSEGVPDPNSLERALAEIESHLADALRDVLRDGIPGLRSMAHGRMIELLVLLRFRVPAFKQPIEESLRSTVRATGTILERQGKLPPPPKGFEDALAMKNLKIVISNWKILQHMFALAADQEVLGLHLSMTPSILHAPDGIEFLTSDQPVAVFNPHSEPGDAIGAAALHPAVEISLPLSSRRLLRLSWRRDDPLRAEVSAGQVAEFNRRTVIMASSYVFAPRASEAALDAVRADHANFAGMQPPEVFDLHNGIFQRLVSRPVMAPQHYTVAPG